MNNDYLSWNEFFIAICYVCSLRSKDPNTKVGACIVDSNNRIISTGYNGLPLNLKDENYPWNNRNKNSILNSKYTYVIHAETNAILFARKNAKNCRLYVTLFPCSQCVKLIIQSEIKYIFYVSDKYNNSDDNIAAKKMLKDANVLYQKINEIELKIKKITKVDYKNII